MYCDSSMSTGTVHPTVCLTEMSVVRNEQLK